MSMWPFNKASKPVAVTDKAQALQQHSVAMQTPQPGAPVSRSTAVIERPTQQTIDPRAEQIKSCIAEGEYLEGNLHFQHGIKVDGAVKGNIEFGLKEGLFVLTHKGQVQGDVIGPRAIIVGEVTGNICVTGRLIILPQARVRGDIAAGTLQLHEGATVEGRICTVPDLQQRAAIEQATNTTGGEVLRFVSNG